MGKTMISNATLRHALSAGHLCADMNQGALAAVLPFLIAARGYDYSTCGMLVFISCFVGSICQPLFGQLADKRNLPWLLTVSVMLAGGGMAVAGFLADFYMLGIAVMLSGIGVSLFHPQGAQLVNRACDPAHRGAGISQFSFGGSLGFAAGPFFITTAVGLFGIGGTLVMLVPSLIIAGVFIALNPGLKRLGDMALQPAAGQDKKKGGTDDWRAFGILSVAVFGRSVVFYGLNTFLALYWIGELGQSEAAGSMALSVFFALGAASTLFGGKLADRYGFRRIAHITFVLLVISTVALAMSKSLLPAWLALVPAGCAICMCHTPMVVLGQQYLPNRIGLASGVTMGLSVSVGASLVPLLGLAADHWGLPTTMWVIAAISIMPMLASFFLPPVGRLEKQEQTAQ